MPHDARGNPLSAGDIVLVPFVVQEVCQGEDNCNVNLLTVATMPPEHSFRTSLAQINTRQMYRANAGDGWPPFSADVTPHGEKTKAVLL